MNSIILSIIIPAYNVEQYIERCILSCIKQNINKDIYEIIVINDGSTDNTLETINKLTLKYTNIKVISKKNGGLSSARNLGLFHAKGKYVWFIDSDDWIEEYCLKEILKIIKINSLNLLWLSWDRYDETNNILNQFKDAINNKEEQNILNGKTFLNNVFGYCAFACAFIMERDFLIKQNFQFKEGLYFEDAYSIPQLIYKAERIKYYPYPIYHYLWRNTSITNKLNLKKINDLILGIEHNLELYRLNPEVEYFKKYASSLVITCIRMISSKEYRCIRGLTISKFKKLELKKLNYEKDIKRNLLIFLYNISPYLCIWCSSLLPRK